MVQVDRYARRKIIATRFGWQKTEKGRNVFISEGEEGEMIGRNKARVGKRVLIFDDEHDRRQFEFKTVFTGKDLKADQKTAAKDIRQRYGGSIKPKYGIAEALMFAPTPETIATMPLIREEAGIVEDKLIPVPPQHPRGSFVDFEKEDADLLASELRKLIDQPVILTGGGGWGVNYMFLEGVKVIAWPEFAPGPDGRPVKDPDKDRKDWRDDPIWYLVDKSKPPKYYSVQVRLRSFPGEADMGEIHTTRQLGSWRLTALSGYGAEKLRKDYPAGWE